MHSLIAFTTAEATPIWPLFQTVCSSIAQVILVCIAGYFLSRRGLLDKATQKQLNIINVNFFTPCLLFSKVAFSLSADKLKELWILPIFFAVVSGVSLVVAGMLGSLLRLDRPHRNFAMAAAMIMNSNSLPVALLQSLVVTVPGLQWDDDDTLDTMVARALSYLLLCGTMGQFLRWSYGVHLLTKSVPPDETWSPSPLPDEIGPMSGGAASQTFRADAPPPSDSDVLAASPYFGSRGYDARGPAWSRPPLTFIQRVVRTGRSTWRKVNDFMTPPLWASVLSLAVALNQPLQHVLGVKLRPIRDAITQAGDCSIPLTLVVLGAYFHRPPDKSELPLSEPTGPQVSLVGSLRRIFSLEGWKADGSIPSHGTHTQEGRTVFVSILARMVVVPALLLPLVVFSRLQGYPQVIQDPVFILSNVLLMASPPALTLAQITQVTSDAFERLISRTIFWSYCIVAPPATVGFALIAMLIARL
ncbi:Membrane transport domain containing protein [Lactarius tabidus]